MKRANQKKGFTLIEMVVVLAVISILVTILIPQMARHLTDVRVARTKNELQVLGAAIADFYKDTGIWPYTNLPGPSGGVNRVVGDIFNIPQGRARIAGPGAERWGNFEIFKPLYDYLYFNNPDEDTWRFNQNEPGQDFNIEGNHAWKGPYIDYRVYRDPWGSSYVINARYFPNNPLGKDFRFHNVYILSAGNDKLWSTPFDDTVNRNIEPDDSPRHDDIGFVLTSN